MEYIEEKEFHYETFYIFIRHLYGDKVSLMNTLHTEWIAKCQEIVVSTE